MDTSKPNTMRDTCDVHVYVNAHGDWETHVASRQATVDDVPIEQATWEPITLPHAGSIFIHHDPEECAENLEQLRAFGYRIPDAVIDDLRETVA